MKFMKWINGNKSLIGSILMIIINSDYVAGLITNPDLYMLLQSMAMAILAGGLAHKAKKAMEK